MNDFGAIKTADSHIDFLPRLEDSVNINETLEPRKVYYRLGESELFNYANKSTKVAGENLVDVIPKMVTTTQGFMHFSLNDFDKTLMYEMFESNRFKLSCKPTMHKMIDGKDVVLVFSEKYKIPVSIPYIIQGDGSQSRVFVNISDFVEMDKFGKINVNTPRNYNGLMGVLVAGCAACTIMHSTSTLPSNIADAVVMTYATMLTKCMSSIGHLDALATEQVKYLATEFALVQMYGTDNGLKLFYRYKTKYFPSLTNVIMNSIDDRFKLDGFDKITYFLNDMAEVIPATKGISLHMLLDKWMRLFGPATTFGMDYLGYHMYTLIAVLMESPLISRMSLEPILEKNGGTELYQGIQRLIEA